MLRGASSVYKAKAEAQTLFTHSSHKASKMYFFGALLVALAASVSGKITKNVGDKWSRVVFCPSTFMFCDPEDYELTAPSGDPIKIFCPTLRTAVCSKAKVTFNDGSSDIEKCGSLEPFQIDTESSKVSIKISGVGGYVDCSAKTKSAPKSYTEVDVSTVATFGAPQRSASEQTDNAYLLKAAEGKKVSIKCTTKLAKKTKSGCVKDILTIDAGDGEKTYCGKGHVNAVSTGSELKLRLETYQATDGTISCKIESV